MNGAMLKLNKVQNKMYVKSNNVPFYVVLFLLTILEFEFEANCEKQILGPPTIEAPSVTTVFKGDTLRLKVNSIVHCILVLAVMFIFQCIIKNCHHNIYVPCQRCIYFSVS